MPDQKQKAESPPKESIPDQKQKEGSSSTDSKQDQKQTEASTGTESTHDNKQTEESTRTESTQQQTQTEESTRTVSAQGGSANVSKYALPYFRHGFYFGVATATLSGVLHAASLTVRKQYWESAREWTGRWDQAPVRTPVNNIEYFPPNFEGLVLGCIDADFCK